MTCPRPESLVPFALGGDDPALARHVAACAACEGELARIREMTETLREAVVAERATGTPDCLDELTIADFVDGRLSAESRAPVVAHLLACARCRATVRGTGRLLAQPAVAQEIRRADRPRWRRWAMPVGAAAAAAALLVLWPHNTDERGGLPALREPASASVAAPLPLSPRAAVTRIDRFVWTGVPRADRYRLRLYDAEGTVLWMTETADTVITRPDSIVLASGPAYFWKIEAQTEWGRWLASELVEFRLAGLDR